MMTKEQLSVWVDGELGLAESRPLVRNLVCNMEPRQTCGLYWVIGDCLRGEERGDQDLTARIMRALQNEPTVLARRVESLRWMPMAAAVAGFAVAVWMGLGLWTMPALETPPVVALKADGVVPVLASLAVQENVLSDERDYLMAHQASAVGAPFTGVASYIRTVSAEQAGGR